METGYCMKCKKKVEMKNAKAMVKNKRKFTMGVCSKCGTKVCRMGG